ncbi:hypothetical protein ASAP_0379 [Asaia bogorensis]|uniref:Uncharacterized protein n=1 Tax=Asaia bogorensis TaxID=91915 RepID=A0A060QBB4_9PROT|nr:hypothetical protein ASAP_0379 [Asaia bogorensis]
MGRRAGKSDKRLVYSNFIHRCAAPVATASRQMLQIFV